MCNERHKHADLIIAFANGTPVEWRRTTPKIVKGLATPNQWLPLTNKDLGLFGLDYLEFRLKPKPKVKKWKWLIHSGAGYDTTCRHFSDQDAAAKVVGPVYRVVCKIDETMVEVEE